MNINNLGQSSSKGLNNAEEEEDLKKKIIKTKEIEKMHNDTNCAKTQDIKRKSFIK